MTDIELAEIKDKCLYCITISESMAERDTGEQKGNKRRIYGWYDKNYKVFVTIVGREYPFYAVKTAEFISDKEPICTK